MLQPSRFTMDQLVESSGATAEQIARWSAPGYPLKPSPEGSFERAQLRTAIALRALVDSGFSDDEAAELMQRSEDRWVQHSQLQSTESAIDYSQVITDLCARIRLFDSAGCVQILDPICDARPLDEVISRLFMPLMKEVGAQWECGEMSVAQEHFTTGLVMRRLSSMTWTWAHTEGASVLLACPPEELHDLPLLSFGAALSARNWRVCYLGANVPWPDMLAAADGLASETIVLAATRPEPLLANRAALHELSLRGRLYLAGAGASAELVRQLGCGEYLAGDPITAATQLDAERSLSSAGHDAV